MHGLVGLGFGDQVFGPLFDGAIFGGAMPVVVDDSVAQDAIEPGYGGLFVVQRRGLLHCADIGTLQDVFGSGWRCDAVLDELEEFAPLKDETVDGFGLH